MRAGSCVPYGIGMPIAPLPGQDAVLNFRAKLPDDVSPDELTRIVQAVTRLTTFSDSVSGRNARAHSAYRPAPVVLRLQYGSEFVCIIAAVAATASITSMVANAGKRIVEMYRTARPYRSTEERDATRADAELKRADAALKQAEAEKVREDTRLAREQRRELEHRRKERLAERELLAVRAASEVEASLQRSADPEALALIQDLSSARSRGLIQAGEDAVLLAAYGVGVMGEPIPDDGDEDAHKTGAD